MSFITCVDIHETLLTVSVFLRLKLCPVAFSTPLVVCLTGFVPPLVFVMSRSVVFSPPIKDSCYIQKTKRK